MNDIFDVVVVGAGPAGCAVASRLADARPDLSVVLLETGPGAHPSVVHAPFGIAATVPRPSERNYAYKTVPQAELGGRCGYQPRGRGVGGSSLINAMVYIRGQKEDYESWAAAGCTGWGWSDVLPYFKRSENNERGGDDLHGAGGPLNVADPLDPSPFSQLFVRAAVEAGFPANRDFNGPVQEGVGLYQVFEKNGERWSAARAYLDSKARTNLTVLANAQALRLVLDEQRRANGVIVLTGSGERLIGARREVVLSAGAFGTPQLLMCSGIGPAGHLKAQGIAVLHDAPEVGGNLQDHLDYCVARLASSRDLIGVTPGFALQFFGAVQRYKKERRGLLTSNISEAGGFLRSRPDLDRPDLQLHFCISPVDDHGRKRHYSRGFSVHVCGLRPESRGTLRLASADMRQAPLIDPRYLSASEDMETLLRGVRLVHRILAAPSIAKIPAKPLYDTSRESDDVLRERIRARADTIYHPVGTCRMGADERSVVDPQLRVRGVERLRIADASVMPSIVSGNTQAPSAMIGEKAADMILSGV